MARIPDHELERLKREVDLAELVRAHGVDLRRRGKDLVGLCPFHEEKQGSFVVSPHKALFHCLGCGAAGSVVDFVMLTRGLTFRQAVEHLQEWLPLSAAGEPPRGAGRRTEPPLPSPLDREAEDHELLDQVVSYYQETLRRCPEAQEYLEKRGINHPEAVKHFRIGFSNRTLGLRLPPKSRKAGAEIRGRLQALGILRGTGHGHLVGCLTFPVFDEQGHVGEVYGRRIDDRPTGGASPHMYLPGPHRGVWNLDAFRESKEIILCEAVVDALSFWTAGLRHVTASFGANGFTQDIFEAMKAYGTKRILIAYDRDDRSDAAAAKLADRLAGEGIASYRVLFPRDTDANEHALANPPASESLAELVRNAQWMAGPVNSHPLPNAPATQPTEDPATASVITEEQASLPLAAGSPPDGKMITEEIPASPVPPPPRLDVPAEVKDHEVVISLGDRRWRVRGLARNTSLEQLRVNVLVARTGAEAFHTDTFDLYAHRPRQAFLKHAASELEVEERVVKKDLGKVLFKLEQLQEERVKAALEPKKNQPVTLTDTEREEALELLKDPKLLDRVRADFRTCGIVGEETNTVTGYLVAVSRKLHKPLAAIIQSSSAAGKSELMNAVLAFMPEEERVHYSAMTGQSLFYMETDLRHRILAIAEEEGAEKASYALKLLQSEGKLSIASTGKDPASGRHVTHEYEVEGPTAILTTTTSIDLNEELESRCIVLAVDESREQTQAIHRMQRERRTVAGILARSKSDHVLELHRNAQRLLRRFPVAVPHVRRLTFLDTKTRARRDHEKYLTLIEAIALLHQHQRRRRRARDELGREVEYLEATLDDIAVANELATEVLGRTLDELPPQTRRFLEMLWQMVTQTCQAKAVDQSDCRLSRRQILDHTGWSYRQVRRHVDRLVELEYLVVHRGATGHTFVYELLWDGQGKDGSPFVIGLADVDKLRKAEGTTHDLPPCEGRSAPPLPPACPPDAPALPPADSAGSSNSPNDLPTGAAEKAGNALIGASKKPGSYVAPGRSDSHPPLAAAAAGGADEDDEPRR